jgi:DNA-binding SARP family transcriptional activator
MNLKLLGTTEITPGTGGAELRRVKERCLLAVLALSPGQVVTAETLLSKVWDEDTPQTDAVRGTLRTYMTRVRAAVAAAGGARVESARGGYLLRIDREDVDVHRFRQLVRQAEAIAHSGDTEHAVSLLREADGLWREEALADLSGRWAESVRYGLDAERRRAAKTRIELEFGLGRHAELVGELRRLMERYPLDETWVGYQMRALYSSGRQADALSVYRQDRDRRVELGLDPSPDLSALQQRILGYDPSLTLIPAQRQAARVAPPNGSLPQRARTFVGREKELGVLCAAPDATPVRIIEGMGGIGKTALAVEAAFRLRDEFPDPPIFLRFHSHEPGQTSLGAREALRHLLELAGAAPEQLPQRTAVLAAMWQRELTRRRSVIVLDDVPDAAAIVSALPVSGESMVLVTSRLRLAGLPKSVVLTLDELSTDEAITLFTRTAGQARIDDPSVLERAVQLCWCLPLALTLSASRLRDGGTAVTEFVTEIEERRAFPDRAGSVDYRLMQTFEGSYISLEPRQREFFRRLGLNPCPTFGARTAAVLVGTSVAEAETALGILHARRLVEPSVADRFRFHDLVREYAAFVGVRDDSGWERRHAERRFLDHYLDSARRADALLYPGRGGADISLPDSPAADDGLVSASSARRWFELEWRNIVRLADYAARHEWKAHCADLGNAMARFLDVRGYWNDAADLHRTALRVCRDLGDLARLARTVMDLSLVEVRTGNYQDALLHAGEAADIYRQAEDARGVAGSLDRMGAVHRYTGQARASLAHHQEALELYRELGDDHGVADALCNSGAAYHGMGRYAEAIVHYENAIIGYREIGDQRGEARCFNNIGDALYDQGLYREALPNFKNALQIYEELDARQHLATVRLNIAHIAQKKGRYQEAVAAYRAVLVTCRETGDLRQAADALYDIGTAYQNQELCDQALIHHRQAEEIAKEIGDLKLQMAAILGIADALCGGGSYAGALDRYADALELALQTEDLLHKGRALQGMAETRFRTREFRAGRILLREALDAYRMAGVPEANQVEVRLAALNSEAI